MNTMTTIISSKNPRADFLISTALTQTFEQKYINPQHFVFFCIGTPKVSGDTLGPAIGSQLSKLHLPHISVYGTLEEPVHALNLTEVWEKAKKEHSGACFIAIDASFGPKTLLGSVCVENHPIFPGRGVGKDLPPVGDISITGIICANCKMRHRQLQKIPLYDVYTQANIIIHGIFQAIVSYFLCSRSSFFFTK